VETCTTLKTGRYRKALRVGKLKTKHNKMRKISLTVLMTISTLTSCFSQDIITKKTAEDIQTKIIEITTSEVKYKKFDNLDGPTFTLLKSEILMIRYENGSKDIFTESQNLNKSDSDMRMKGKQDATTFYKGKKSGAGWTAATTIVISPLFGLIPAIACASSEPSDHNLKYRNPELMEVNAYNQAYSEQAHKMKKRKIWTSFGVASGAWLLLILLL
jgi:hypothetical protein